MTGAQAPNYQSGDTLPGTKYRVRRRLAHGGMGVLFEVVKSPDIRGVAKLLSSEFLNDGRLRGRFMAEARILAQLDHPNIVRIFDYDVLEDRTPFFVMELLNGKSLAAALDTQRTFPPRMAYRVMRQLSSALQAAHTHDTPVVHRDVKPSNIFLHKPKHGEAVVKLIDFGVVMPSANKQTLVAGTPGYMAPEQLQAGMVIDARTDIYACAVVLYEMLTGHGPFPLQEQAGAVVHATLVAPPDPIRRYADWVPESVAEAIARALDKDPANRHASVEDFFAAISELDRADLFGSEELPFLLRDESNPRLMTQASFTAIVRTPTPGEVLPEVEPFSDATAPRHRPTVRKKDFATFETRESDTSVAIRKRWQRAEIVRWAGLGVVAALLIVGTGLGVRALLSPEHAPAGVTMLSSTPPVPGATSAPVAVANSAPAPGNNAPASGSAPVPGNNAPAPGNASAMGNAPAAGNAPAPGNSAPTAGDAVAAAPGAAVPTTKRSPTARPSSNSRSPHPVSGTSSAPKPAPAGPAFERTLGD